MDSENTIFSHKKPFSKNIHKKVDTWDYQPYVRKSKQNSQIAFKVEIIFLW